jgi:hypothetical protein
LPHILNYKIDPSNAIKVMQSLDRKKMDLNSINNTTGQSGTPTFNNTASSRMAKFESASLNNKGMSMSGAANKVGS